MTAYIIVDMQNDFLTGSLGAKTCVDCIKPIDTMIRKNVTEEDIVIFTKDTHEAHTYPNTKEGSCIPAHCFKDTEGWELDPLMKKLHDDLSEKFQGNVFTVNKKTFGSDFLMNFLSEHEEELSRIVLCGVCTSICVHANAVIARTACPNADVVVVKDCCGDGNPIASEHALESLKSLQIDVVDSL